MPSQQNVPGASARKEYEKRLAAREARVLKDFPRIGRLLIRIITPSQRTTAWGKGALGEEAIGDLLNQYATENNWVILHDLAIPNSKANIDHVLITNFAVFVIDSKNYQGLIEVRETGSIFQGYQKDLYIGGRKKTALITGIAKQVQLISAEMSESVPVRGVLAFYKGEFPLLFKPSEIDGVLINSKGIKKILEGFPREVELNIESIAKTLQKTFRFKAK